MQGTSAQEEYDKMPELKREDITALLRWSEAQPFPAISERDLIVFHHSCHFDLERTQACVESYFKIRSKNPVYFSNRDPESESVRKAFNTTGYYILDGLTRDGYRVLLMRLIKTSPSCYNFNDTLKIYTMVADAIFLSSGSCAGDVIVYDMSGTSFGHLPKLNVGGFKTMLQYLQEGLPVRLKGIYLINAIPFVDILVNMMTPFMKKELLDMFHVSSSSEVMQSLLSQSQLPREYGGDGKTLEQLRDQTLRLVNERREFFIKDDARRITSPIKAKSKEKSTITKSFQKLELD